MASASVAAETGGAGDANGNGGHGGGGDNNGNGGGGGGGSSYVGSGTSASYTAAVGTSHGQVTITYDPFPLTYYLGAIADYEDTVSEFDENNNSKVQTSGGSPQGTTVSVVSQLNAASTDNSGGGTFGLMELLLGLGGLGMVLRRRSVSV